MHQICRTSIQTPPTFDPDSPVENKALFAQVMAWCRTADKASPQSMMTQFATLSLKHPQILLAPFWIESSGKKLMAASS